MWGTGSCRGTFGPKKARFGFLFDHSWSESIWFVHLSYIQYSLDRFPVLFCYLLLFVLKTKNHLSEISGRFVVRRTGF